MSNPNIAEHGKNTRFVPGQSGNPAGKPKGAVHLSTRIQNMLDDDDFETMLKTKDGKKIEFKGNPAEAIIKTAILKAMGGSKDWAEWLAKHGYGTKQIHEFTNSPVEDILEKYGLSKEAVENDLKEEKKDNDRQTEATT